MNWDIIGKTSYIASLISLVPICISLWLVIQIKGQRRKQLAEIRKHPGARPAFLIIDVVPSNSIKNTVVSWIGNEPKFEDLKGKDGIPSDIIFHLNRDEPTTPDTLDNLIKDFRKIKAQIMQRGTDQLHMFCSAPMEVAIMIGAELGNSMPVIVYHNKRNKTGYEDWGPMERPW